MKLIFLKNDGRCKWLDNKILKTLYPELLKKSRDPRELKSYIILDWLSNDSGKIGVDLKWLRGIGVSAVENFRELPFDEKFQVVNTGYDSIVHEEKILREKGIEFIDKPCPFVRRIRSIFENHNKDFQYIFLCEPNHIMIKNYASIFPKDMILVQMHNYQEKIKKQECGKPFVLVSYTTFLREEIDEVYSYLQNTFPDREIELTKTQCLWANSKVSPITEIEAMNEELNGVNDALLIATKGTLNKSVNSLVKTLEKKGLQVTKISSLKEFKSFAKQHKSDKVLLVRSPIPNMAESPILAYIKRGNLAALIASIKQNKTFQVWTFGLYNKLAYYFKYVVQKLGHMS